ncbi:MAG: short-chain dehydrogenase [Ilumatobacteraceae bacterium]|nr:short-chain dehydrogenase [Ilumatobacteraceae bacterium]
MDNALGQPQTIVLLGGTSDIGLAIVRELLSPATRAIVLACRDTSKGERAAGELRSDSVVVEVVPFDAADPSSHAALVEGIGGRYGDIDVVILAAGLLGNADVTTVDVAAATELATVNFTGSVSVTVAAANLLRAQGHGAIVILSSVAGERVRAANPVYGGTKAGLDGFAQGLGDLVAADGVHVLVVRPGFVRSAMTAGLKPAPLSTTPEHVARLTVKGLRAGRRTVWAPGALRYVFSALRHVPAPIWRRLPLG